MEHKSTCKPKTMAKKQDAMQWRHARQETKKIHKHASWSASSCIFSMKGCDIKICVKPPIRDHQVHIGTEFKSDQHLCIFKDASKMVCEFQTQHCSLTNHFANILKQWCNQAPLLGMNHIANSADKNCMLGTSNPFGTFEEFARHQVMGTQRFTLCFPHSDQ